jgi:hypothetical protein
MAELDLHHDAVPRPKNMIGRRQGETVKERRVGLDRPGPGEALAVATAENVGGNHELIAPHDRFAADFVGIPAAGPQQDHQLTQQLARTARS